MEESTPVINLIFHNAVFLLSILAFFGAVLAWRKRKASRNQTGEYWMMFTYGLFFYAVSEFSDLFTPGLRASLGMHNYFTELSLLVGLAFIFIGIRRLIISER